MAAAYRQLWGVKPWGRCATFGLALIAMSIGQIAAVTALIWWTGLPLAQLPDVTSNGVAVILMISISTPVQVLLLILFARSRGGSATDYLGLTLPRRSEVVIGLLVILIFLAASEGITWLAGATSLLKVNLKSIVPQGPRATFCSRAKYLCAGFYLGGFVGSRALLFSPQRCMV